MRKPARKYPMKSSVINFRIQPSTLDALKKAAAASGRTVSAEAEHQLHRALSDIGHGRSYAVMATIAMAIDTLAARRRRKWWNDVYSFEQAAKVVASAFALLRPPGAPAPEGEPFGEHSAEFAIQATLREIQTADLTVPFDRRTNHQKWLALMKAGLGDLADRPALFGQTADQARALNEAAKPILAELIPLSKKTGKTPAEAERLAELERELVKLQQGRKRK